MQLISINISNILSFPYQEEFSEEKKIHFDVNKKGGLNILIGPNGSGKTNFIEIITQLIKVGLIKDFVILNDRIIENKRILENMIPHFSHKERESKIEIEIHISESDKENMLFLQKNKNIISTIIKENSDIDYQINSCKKEEIDNLQTIHIQFKIDTQNQTAHIYNNQKNKESNFALEYLMYQELFQIAIMIYNTKIKKSDEISRYNLKNTFGHLNNTRNFSNLKRSETNINLRENFISKKNYRDNNSLIGYALCIKKIDNIYTHTTEKDKIKAVNESPFFIALKKSIKKYLNLDMYFKYEEKILHLYFLDSTGQEQTIYNISHGEQSLLIILFTIYGYDLRNNLLIIDEPELHFHPQIQRRLAKMLEKLNESIGTQCIVSTYSPIFIDEKNIANVYRFSKKNGETIIRVPDKNIGNDESSLIQILKFENAAKIFFVDKIIMVEGETDAYFFEYYLQYLHTLPEWKDKLTNYEIININGKGSYKKRSSFLKKFGIESYFIGDWDNTVDYGFVSQEELNGYYRQAKNLYHNNKINFNEDNHYAKLVHTVKSIYPSKYNSILENIEILYKKNIFILKRGDIETYLGMKSKGLEETIFFCHNIFDIWLENKKLSEHIIELEKIIGIIFNQQD